MKIYTPFNYIFYCLYKLFNSERGFFISKYSDDTYNRSSYAIDWFSVAGIIASLQWINIQTLICLIFGKVINTDRFLMILVPIYVALVVLNSLIYRKYKRYENMCAMWDEDSRIKKRIKGLLVLIYILVSCTALFISLAKVYS